MSLLRPLLYIAILGYAVWLAWPFLSPFFEGAPLDVAMQRAVGVLQSFGTTPRILFWVAAIILYVIAALLLGSGNPRAALAYFLGFLADAALRLALDRSGGSGADASIQAAPYAESEMTQRSAQAVAPAGLPIDPTWVILIGLIVVGVLVFVASRRAGRRRAPSPLAV